MQAGFCNKATTIDSASSFWRCTVLGQVEDIKNKLDPISVLAVLALLKFKETGTLIGFNGYLVTTEAPSSIQGVVRRIYGESREDLDIIPNAIEKVTSWFQPEKGETNIYRNLCSAAYDGLAKLQETYLKKSSKVTVAAISDWMKSIQIHIEPKHDDEIPEPPALTETDLKVRGLWTAAEIREVNSLIAQMVERQGEVSPDIKIKCGDQIARLELLLKQHSILLAEIYEG